MVTYAIYSIVQKSTFFSFLWYSEIDVKYHVGVSFGMFVSLSHFQVIFLQIAIFILSTLYCHIPQTQPRLICSWTTEGRIQLLVISIENFRGIALYRNVSDFFLEPLLLLKSCLDKDMDNIF